MESDYPPSDPRVDYELTRLGHSLSEAFCGVWQWAEAHLEEVESARGRFDAARMPD